MKALVVGSALIDTIAVIESYRVERMTMRNAETSFLLLEEGRKTEALEVSTHCGGGGTNGAVALARLGFDVAALIKLGQDARAETVLDRLMAERVSTRFAARDARVPTGAAVHIASHERDAAIFTFRGANTLLEPADLRDDAFAVDLVLVSSLSNQSADCFPIILGKAKAHGAMVAANPGVRQLSARRGSFHDCLGRIDALSVNRAEADALVPGLVERFGEGGPTLALEAGEEPPALAARGLQSGGFEMSLVALLRAIVGSGPPYVVVTDGRHGAYVGTRERVFFCPALPTEVAGTAGAGDAFVATFAAFVALGRPVEDALRAATLNASSVMSHVDTQTGLLRRAEIESRLADAASRLAMRSWPI